MKRFLVEPFCFCLSFVNHNDNIYVPSLSWIFACAQLRFYSFLNVLVAAVWFHCGILVSTWCSHRGLGSIPDQGTTVSHWWVVPASTPLVLVQSVEKLLKGTVIKGNLRSLVATPENWWTKKKGVLVQLYGTFLFWFDFFLFFEIPTLWWKLICKMRKYYQNLKVQM